MRLRALFCTSFSLFRSISSTSYSIAGRTFKQSSIFVPRLSEPISILEADERTQNALVDIALDTNDQVNSDPYGSVLWPAALSVAARVLEYSDLKECNIVELGAGTGLVSLACALAGIISLSFLLLIPLPLSSSLPLSLNPLSLSHPLFMLYTYEISSYLTSNYFAIMN